MRFTLCHLTVTVLLAAACGGSPASPSSTAGSLSDAFAGVWQVEYRVTECSGERHCAQFIGQVRQAALRLARMDTSFEGAFTIVGETISVTGSLGPDGELALKGLRPAVLPSDLEVEIVRLRLRRGITGLSGDLEYTIRGPSNVSFFGFARQKGDIITAKRTANISASPLDLNFTGSWKGQFVVRECTSAGWPSCYPYGMDRVHSFTLSLRQIGSDVEGSLTISPLTIPVSGMVAAGTLELRGSQNRPISGGSEVVHITSWSTRRDIVGRMTGTFAFTLEWPGLGTGDVLYTTVYRRLELQSTVLSD